MAMDYILATKLVIPDRPAHLVARPRLTLPQDAARVTLVCAPAGYGKTTLLSIWAHALPVRALWLTLDAGDNDPAQFLTSFVSAFQTGFPDFAQALTGTLASTPLPPLPSLTRALLNELGRLPERACLMIDDLQTVTNPGVHEALGFIAEHLPAQLQLVIASRTQPAFPLSRLRMQRQLAELQAEELRFTHDEVSEFCNELMNLDLTPALVDSLETRTEGWIVGLQLAALSLYNNPDKQGFIDSFAGDDRLITDFLFDQVLRDMADSRQQFLLYTCLLPQFSAPLCDEIRLAHDSRQQIDELERANLFIVRLDHRRVWYRYHHLFTSLLKARLQEQQPGMVKTIHHRASQWFREHGMISEAVWHGLQAGNFQQAAELMEEHSAELFSLGRITTAIGWAQQLPAPVLGRHPKLSMLCAWAGLIMDNLPEVERHVRIATALLAPHADAPAGSRERALYGQLALISGCYHCLAGDVERAQASVLDALGSLSPGRMLYRGASVCLGFCYYAQGELDKAQRLFEENARISEARTNVMIPVFATLGLARTHLLRGQLQSARNIYTRALRECEALGWQNVPVCGMLHIGLGELAYETNDLATARLQLEKGVGMTSAGQLQYFNAWAQVLLAQTQLAQNEPLTLTPGGEALLMRYSGRFLVEVPPVSAALASLWLNQGRLDMAEQWVRDAQLPLQGQLAGEREAEYLALARYLVMSKRSAEALDLLARLWFNAEQRQHVRALVEIQILRAMVQVHDGQTTKALATLQHAVVLAGDSTLVRLFSRESPLIDPLLQVLAQELPEHPLIPDLLEAVGQAAPPTPKSLAHLGTFILSKKERLVARHIVTGATSQEIAERMCVSLSTIKTHTQNIYSKLGVNKRLQAIEALLRLNLA